MTVVIVTGTGTDVGKTVATAALAATLEGSVAVVKPAQTGVADGAPGDLAEVTRLSGVTAVHEFARYPDPLSPHQAAQLAGRPPLDEDETVERIEGLDDEHDWVLVEGAGGLLVPYDVDRWTIEHLGARLDATFVVVVEPGLGSLNHTFLTLGRLEEYEHELVIGSWPDEPDLAMRMNLTDFHLAGNGVAGVLPAGMGAMRDFRQQARAALAPRFGGTFDWPAFRRANRP